MRGWLFIVLLLVRGGEALPAQTARLLPADPLSLPLPADGNSASFRWDGRLRVITSIGFPLRLHVLTNPADWEWESGLVEMSSLGPKTAWVEGAWPDEAGGVVFGWYHHEPGSMVPDTMLTAPRIGALLSFDGGRSVQDLGFILESGDAINPEARNGFFVGGHGDFSVVLDRERQFFYFFFTNYGGDPSSHGVCVARLAFEDRFDPVGRLRKYHEGAWEEPGLGGRVTPIHRAVRGWEHADPDSYWGASVHWNTHLGRFVMVMNRAQGEPGWSQEGIYVSFSSDPAQPETWTEPALLLGKEEIPDWTSFYPQVFDFRAQETGEAGEIARFFLNGRSWHEIEFTREEGRRRRPPLNPVPQAFPPGLPGGGG